MKKFDHWHVIQVAGYPAYKSPTTYWVKAEDAEALEQLNKEMLEALKEASALFPSDEESLSFYTYDVQKFVHNLQSIIKKGEEV